MVYIFDVWCVLTKTAYPEPWLALLHLHSFCLRSELAHGSRWAVLSPRQWEEGCTGCLFVQWQKRGGFSEPGLCPHHDFYLKQPGPVTPGRELYIHHKIILPSYLLCSPLWFSLSLFRHLQKLGYLTLAYWSLLNQPQYLHLHPSKSPVPFQPPSSHNPLCRCPEIKFCFCCQKAFGHLWS